MKIFGKLVDIHNREIFPAAVIVNEGRIERILREDRDFENYILPGLIDSHIHIESAMITPGSFALSAVKHGTIGVVTDPHEIANVLGIDGVLFMMRDADKVPVNFWFGAPSCVPATDFETSGAKLTAGDLRYLMELPAIKYMSEMMNFPGVVNKESDTIEKLALAKEFRKPVDGHAPGLTGELLREYIQAGISTDHECSSITEALEKISYGMKILIREGSAARNLDALKELYNIHPDKVMLCSDDMHPEMLKERHINKLISKLISEGYNLFDVIRSATINPVKHYDLQAGLLREGDSADFILVGNLREMNILETWIRGKRVYGDGKVHFSYVPDGPINKFNCKPLAADEIKVLNKGGKIRVIEAFDGELVTSQIVKESGTAVYVDTDLDQDVLKIVVKDRYKDTPPSIGFIKGFGLKSGAFAGSVAHDSHNIISIGTNDTDIVKAINEIVRIKGGLAVSCGGRVESIQLNIGGIMTTRSGEDVASDYVILNSLLKSIGCQMKAPFMTLSFMALLVIPDLKISDQGLFDVKKFRSVSLFIE